MNGHFHFNSPRLANAFTTKLVRIKSEVLSLRLSMHAMKQSEVADELEHYASYYGVVLNDACHWPGFNVSEFAPQLINIRAELLYIERDLKRRDNTFFRRALRALQRVLNAIADLLGGTPPFRLGSTEPRLLPPGR